MARLRLARRIADGSAEIVLGDVTALPWPDSRFSAVVWLWGVEVMVGDPHQALAEIRRVLGPDGRAVLSVGALFDDEKARAKLGDLPGFWQWTQARACEEIMQAGFADPEIRHIKVGGPRYSRVSASRSGSTPFVWPSRTLRLTHRHRIEQGPPAGGRRGANVMACGRGLDA